MKNYLSLVLLAFISFTANAESHKLTGTIIGSEYSVDYAHNNVKSTTVNTRNNAFDGDLETFFASYDRSLSWAGLDLGTPHKITQVGWSPRNHEVGPERVCLGVFEGANKEDFSDGVPLYLIPKNGVIGQMQYAKVTVTRAFRYVRYIGPNNARCNIAEIEVHGEEVTEPVEKEVLYQPTNLPTVVVHVADNKEPVDKVNDLVANFSIISKDGKKELSQSGTFRLRGNASMNFEKKPYRIKFDKKQNVLDAPAKAKKWTLVACYGDKTLMRNIIGFELSRRFGQKYTPYIQPVDVFVNGEYKGCYSLCDQVEVNPGRVEIEEMTPEDITEENLTGGYFLEVDAYAYQEPAQAWFNSNNGNPVTIKYPSDDEIVPEQYNYIKKHFNTLEAALFSSLYTSETNGYRKYLDLESFLNHFLYCELNGNTDTFWSLNLYKYRNDNHFYTGPVWDLDLAFENDNRTYPIDNLTDWIYNTKGSVAGNFKKFVNRIVKEDAKAQIQMKEIWAEARSKKDINAESLNQFVDATAKLLAQSQELNFKRWKIMDYTVHQNPWVWGNYKEEVNNVKQYIEKRIAKMDQWLGYDPSDLPNISDKESANSNIKVYNLQGVLKASLTTEEAISTLPSGNYILLYGNGETKTIIKK